MVKPDYSREGIELYCADCQAVLGSLSGIDACVTDPPYGLSFMGKHWDYDVPSQEIWESCFAALKPGAHLLAFAGTRTQHRMAVRIEDAGFEIRDMIAWVYGSGFPKSMNLKGERDGWGTALKPALEPITVARKPLVGTVAQNVERFGTGAINVDGCRVEAEIFTGWGGSGSALYEGGLSREGGSARPVSGRWPANLIHDGSDEVKELFPQTGASKASYRGLEHSGRHGGLADLGGNIKDGTNTIRGHDDNGGSAARFFYCAKASRADRNDGLVDPGPRRKRNDTTNGKYAEAPNPPDSNFHPTVKPTDLMRYLCRLITPPNGIILDPFMGSGSTGKAAIRENFRFIGIEKDRASFDIAVARVEAELNQGDLFRQRNDA